MAQQKQETSNMDTSYLDAMAAQGLDNIGQNAVATAYLSMVQPGSTVVSAVNPEGTWRNSATDVNYGKSVEVIPLAFKTVWTERDTEPPFMTVGRYEPNTIEVRVERPKPGKKGFPKMVNPATGNKVEELFIYACLLNDHQDAGVVYFSPTVGSMKACKQWNSLLRSQRLPSGKLAPIFAFSWILDLDLVPNPAQPGREVTKFIHVTRGNLIAKDLFEVAVQPQLEVAQKSAGLLVAPEQSGDTEAE